MSNVDNRPPSQSLFGQTPGYQLFDNPKSDLIELIQREENKYFAERPLYALSGIQMIFGAFLVIAQIFLNSNCEKCVSTVGIWAGCAFILCGLLSCLTTKFKLDSLLVVSGFLSVLINVVSIACCIISGVMVRYITETYAADNQTYIQVYASMAIISGLNLIIAILISAFLCRAGCSCCQPQSPTIMYLGPTADSAPASTTTVRVETVSSIP